MGLLDSNLGYREITGELLESIGFKAVSPSALVMTVNGKRCYPYDLYIKSPVSWQDWYHHFRYVPETNELEIKIHVSCGRPNEWKTVKPDNFDDILVIVGSYMK